MHSNGGTPTNHLTIWIFISVNFIHFINLFFVLVNKTMVCRMSGRNRCCGFQNDSSMSFITAVDFFDSYYKLYDYLHFDLTPSNNGRVWENSICNMIVWLVPVKCVGGDYCIWHTEWSRLVFRIVIYGHKLHILL